MRLLFIGNSHTYVNDLPELVAENARKDGYPCEVTMLTHPGWYLRQHAEWPEIGFNIRYGHYDYVILQEHAHPFDCIEDYRSACAAIVPMIRAAGSVPVLYETWAPKVKPEVQAFMNETHREIAERNGMRLAPVGEQWALSEERGEFYAADGEHASPKGSLFAATIIWNTIREAETHA